MSQSATLYRITAASFQKIEKAEAKYVSPTELTADYVIFTGSFIGLEFILLKDVDEGSRELIAEIFNSNHYIGPATTNIFNLDSDEEEEQYWEAENAIGYLAPNKVKKIATLLTSIQERKIAESYNAEELNANSIYPCCWVADECANIAFNRRHLLEDFRKLQDFFQAAASEKNYVLCCVG